MTLAVTGRWIFAALIAISASPAMADLPQPVRAMLNAAIASGSESDVATVAKLAKATNPDDVDEIDRIVADHRIAIAAVEEAHRQAANMFDDWHGDGELGGFITTGNTDSTGVSAGIALNKKGIDWRHKIHLTADYQRSDGETTRNQWLASYEPNFNITETFYLFGLIMYEKDRFQGFIDRVTLSGGLGYRVVDSPAMTLDVKGGPAWRRANWIDEPAASESSGLVGADFLWKFARGLEFANNAQALWETGNSTYSNTASLSAKLNGALSARLSYAVRHETNPPPDTRKSDTITRATLVYGF